MHNSIKQISKKFDGAIINRNKKKLNNLISLGKDKLSALDKRNKVYKIDCTNCDTTYIGQSSRKLNFRTDEHKQKSTSSLAKHV